MNGSTKELIKELIIPEFFFFLFILVTRLLDIVLVLLGEILS